MPRDCRFALVMWNIRNSRPPRTANASACRTALVHHELRARTGRGTGSKSPASVISATRPAISLHRECVVQSALGGEPVRAPRHAARRERALPHLAVVAH